MLRGCSASKPTKQFVTTQRPLWDVRGGDYWTSVVLPVGDCVASLNAAAAAAAVIFQSLQSRLDFLMTLPLIRRLEEVDFEVSCGTSLIDIVIDRQFAVSGRKGRSDCDEECSWTLWWRCRSELGSLTKVIITETDFIKTSTGKI